MNDRMMPLVFVGHGSPMNAIEDNEFSRAWQEAARELPKPEAIVCISAHWETRGSLVTAMEKPRTIHDFYGFPKQLAEIQYPASGSTGLARRLMELVQTSTVTPDLTWGLDHGTWSVLCRMYPQADIPVVQLSLDRGLEAQGHYALGEQLRPLRHEGVLILGSGNMVHNLRMMVWEDTTFDWAATYDAKLAKWMLEDDHEPIIHYENQGTEAMLAVNSAEHYLPLLYILGAKEKGEPLHFFAEKVWGGSLSMRCVRVG